MAWATVGYHAVEQKVFDAAVRQESEGDWFCGMSLQSWFATPLCAISQTRKENVRKLGLSLSETGDPPKGKVSKRLPGKTVVDAALECPNYVVWRLQTTENIAELLSQGFLRAGKNKFELRNGLEPFLPFGQADKWHVDYASLVSTWQLFFFPLLVCMGPALPGKKNHLFAKAGHNLAHPVRQAKQHNVLWRRRQVCLLLLPCAACGSPEHQPSRVAHSQSSSSFAEAVAPQ